MFPMKNAVPSRYPPVVTWCLIAVNCGAFLFQQSLSPIELEALLRSFALVPARYFGPYAYAAGDLSLTDFLPFITNTFIHGGWLHLILNMWSLWVFGGAVEDRFGHGRFLAFYLACGVLASLAHAIFNPFSTVPALGASGAIAGVMGAFVNMFPLARLVVVVPIIFIPLFFEVPAIAFVGIWFLLQVLQGAMDLLMPTNGAGVAWWAHIGGFLAGIILAPVIRRSESQYRLYYGDEGVLGFDTQGRRL
jgi:membrane associated rhomboid family serine protease